ncbi:hypothetical protein K438DRAFT_1776885 [Mycena galopus ATCC 62051]|nr:hypothetical protein K438DRAFT_1776885 [Mycena galopus ATCC 62051]
MNAEAAEADAEQMRMWRQAEAEDAEAEAKDVHMEPRNCGRQLDSNRRIYAMVNDIATVVQDGKKHIYFSYRDTDADADTDTDTDTGTDRDTDTEESRQWFGVVRNTMTNLGMYLQPVLVPKILVVEQHVEK